MDRGINPGAPATHWGGADSGSALAERPWYDRELVVAEKVAKWVANRWPQVRKVAGPTGAVVGRDRSPPIEAGAPLLKVIGAFNYLPGV